MNFTPRLMRLVLNIYPPYIGTGVKVERIADDWKLIDVSMKLRWYNRNAVRTHFGGSLYSMTDPHLMLMLMQILGSDYVVWDKAASIEFIRPGKGRVSVTIKITEDDLKRIKTEVERKSKALPEFNLDIVDEQGCIVARVTKTLYVRRKHGSSLS